ncbi:HoxN/HupN/NixA family nickel/cobalt transporter [Pseudonocardia acidicola]|uniref:Nickel/cobalt efflux system n=1 Tax=Pseudonocardia acidicola TaxID=2724939 RepID=A0ABX1SG62_9PSEU|nr:HoxN/HupN/NixA family nickel/cobalt transporter [Pseudonocardia acidicola]NMH99148.1 HoxN/HupN/NixA family nickel/cobalt transporter [Pseudonocardia acidicola]
MLDAVGSPRRIRFDRTDWFHIAGMAGFVLLLTVTGWLVLVGVVAPGHFSLGDQGTFGVGIGLTAYLLGMRHAFDADHIAAIDNTTRKLVGEGKRARGVGFWFSLGHSSVVFLLCLLLSLGIRTLVGDLGGDSSSVKQTLGFVGTLVGGGFLVLIGLLNLLALIGVTRVFARMRTEPLDDDELERHLNSRGFLARILNRVMRVVGKPWHMFPVGFVFGLGFDTASEVALLVLAGGAAAFNLPWYAILVIPVLFAAGMSLFDTADGVFMSAAYGWAFLKPVRKVFYNLTITALSVMVALVIGMIELLQLLGAQLGVDSGLLGFVQSLNLEYVGYVIVGLFVATWLAALAVWRFGRIEERWSAAPAPAGATASAGD